MPLACAPHEQASALANSRQQALPIRRRCWLNAASSSQPHDPARSRWPGQLAQHARQVEVHAGTLSNSSCSQIPALITLPAGSGQSCAHEHGSGYAAEVSTTGLLQPQHHVIAHDTPTTAHSISMARGWSLSTQPSHATSAVAAAELTVAASHPCSNLHEVPHPEHQYQQHLQHQEQWQQQPEDGHARVKAPAKLMCYIKYTRTIQDLHVILQQYSHQLNKLHASAACTHAGQLLVKAHADGHTTHVSKKMHKLLLQLQLRHLHEFGARQVANSLWAHSKLLPASHATSIAGSRGLGDCTLQQLQQQVLQGLLHRLPSTLRLMQPQEMANTWYAIACLQPYQQVSDDLVMQLVRASQQHLQAGFKPQEVFNVLWAAAGLLPKVSAHSGSSSQAMSNIRQWLAQLMQIHSHIMHKLSASELAGSLWAIAQLWQLLPTVPSIDSTSHARQPLTLASSHIINHNHSGTDKHRAQHQVNGTTLHQQQQQQQPWLAWGIEQHTAAMLSDHQDHHVASTASATAWALRVTQHLQLQHTQLGSAELVAVLSALRRLPAHPAHATLACSLLQLAQRSAQQRKLTPRAAACVLSAAAWLQLPPDAGTRQWAADIVQHAMVASGSCSIRDVQLALHALARLRCRPTARTAQQLLQQGRRHMSQGSCSPTQVAFLLWVCAKLSLLPPTSFLAVFQKTSYAAVQYMPPAALTALFWALGVLRVRLGLKWCDNALACVWKRRADFQTGELLQVLASLGRMQYPLSDEMSEQVVSELQHRCSRTTAPQQLLATVSAIARLPTVSASTLRWAAHVLIEEMLQPCISQLRPADLVSLWWSYAQVCSRLQHTAIQLAPKRQYSAVQYGSMDEGDDAVLQEMPVRCTWPLASDSSATGAASQAACSSPHGCPIQQGADAGAVQGGALPHSAAEVQAAHGSSSSSSNVDGVDATDATDAVGAVDGTHIPADTTAADSWMLFRGKDVLALNPDVVSSALQRAAQVQQQLTAQQRAVMLYAVTRLGVRPSRAWLHQLVFSNPQRLTQFNHHELALTVFSLGCMGCEVPMFWMQACLSEVLVRAPAMNTGAVSGVLRGLSLMDFTPGPAWLSAYMSCVTRVLALMPPKQLSKVYAAVVDLDPQLADDWGHDFCNLLKQAEPQTIL